MSEQEETELYRTECVRKIHKLEDIMIKGYREGVDHSKILCDMILTINMSVEVMKKCNINI